MSDWTFAAAFRRLSQKEREHAEQIGIKCCARPWRCRNAVEFMALSENRRFKRHPVYDEHAEAYCGFHFKRLERRG